MFGNNAYFIADPFNYVKQCVINNTNLGPSSGHNMSELEVRNLLAEMEQAKKGYFDLEQEVINGHMNVRLHSIVGNSHSSRRGMEKWIQAYYLGYQMPGVQKDGLQRIPRVDIPRTNPTHNFLFTGAMNGCSLIITEPANQLNTLRVWHDSVKNVDTFKNETVVLRLDYDAKKQFRDKTGLHESLHTYSDTSGGVSNSCNFMYYDTNSGHWVLVSQPQIILPIVLAKQNTVCSAPPVQINKGNPPFEIPVPPQMS